MSSNLAYYQSHSLITHPRSFADLFNKAPKNLSEQIQIVQNLLMHFSWAESYSYTVPSNRKTELLLRTIPEMITQILVLNDKPLRAFRGPEERLISICRDYGVLLVAMLRQNGIPARLRVGFAGYFKVEGLPFLDHRITEYWHAEQNRWVLVDSQLCDMQCQALSFTTNPHNISKASPFLLAGEVWKRCRRGQLNPMDFGDSPEDLGMASIRYGLLHDFDALNKNELVGFDAWHDLIDKPDSQLTETDLKFLDQVADLTSNVDVQFDAMRQIYRNSSYGKAVNKIVKELVPPT